MRTKCLLENHEGKNHFGNEGMSWKVRLKMDVRKKESMMV